MVEVGPHRPVMLHQKKILNTFLISSSTLEEHSRTSSR
uniref:Uncharacterized protein n=1 Tax=Anguilla anguilla TaxID=7936 RepID=A0A0E9T0E9_ANGAN